MIHFLRSNIVLSTGQGEVRFCKKGQNYTLIPHNERQTYPLNVLQAFSSPGNFLVVASSQTMPDEIKHAFSLADTGAREFILKPTYPFTCDLAENTTYIGLASHMESEIDGRVRDRFHYHLAWESSCQSQIAMLFGPGTPKEGATVFARLTRSNGSWCSAEEVSISLAYGIGARIFERTFIRYEKYPNILEHRDLFALAYQFNFALALYNTMEQRPADSAELPSIFNYKRVIFDMLMNNLTKLIQNDIKGYNFFFQHPQCLYGAENAFTPFDIARLNLRGCCFASRKEFPALA